MYTRNVRVKLKPDSVAEFTDIVEHKIIPLLRAQKGFQDEITLFSPQRNEVLAISFWDDRQSADAYNHVAYLDVLRSLSTVVQSVPAVESFEVVGSTFHDRTPRTA